MATDAVPCIEVVTGVVMRGGRLLLTQRGTRSDFALMWESPGGKVEPNESAADALARELAEEIGWTGDSGAMGRVPFYETALALPSKTVRLRFFAVHPKAAFVPELRDANTIGAGWFTLAQAQALPCLPGNVALYPQLEAIGWPSVPA